ncbi:MAG: hypothetical protein A2V70_16385 [Planctomycetes bacterium RBG_13_63_9]|nr:MAG: hypothetical protein A2V70_16385 [Planctomycetes bacterium RBG_13_63_9]
MVLLGVTACAAVAGYSVLRSYWPAGGVAEATLEPKGPQRPTPSQGPAEIARPQGNQQPQEGPSQASDPEPSVAEPPPDVRATVEALKEEELEVARQLIKDFPDSPDPIGLLGNVHSKHGNNSEAAECWEKTLQMQPDRVSALVALGTVALRNDQFEKAVELWRKALELDAAQPDARASLAEALMALGKIQEAIVELEKDVEVSANAWRSHCLLGQAHMQLREYEKAKESFEAAIRIQPNDAKSHYGLANVCARLKLGDESTRYLKRFQELNAAVSEFDRQRRDGYDDLEFMLPRVAETFNSAAGFYHAHGNAQKAEQLWQRASALDAKNIESRTRLVQWYRQNDRVQEALQVCEQLRDIEPTEAGHHLAVGMLSAQLKQFGKAERAFRKVCQLSPKHSWGYRFLAQIYLETDRNVPEALALARQAVDLEPSAPNYFVLCAAHAKSNNPHSALLAAERAIKLDPNNKQYRQTYERLRGMP